MYHRPATNVLRSALETEVSAGECARMSLANWDIVLYGDLDLNYI